MVRYTDEEYHNYLEDRHGSWMKDNTDVLFDLCRRFDLRWPVIHDRFSGVPGEPKSLEALKHRFYRVTSIILAARRANHGRQQVVNHTFAYQDFDYKKEEDEQVSAGRAPPLRTQLTWTHSAEAN